MEELCIEQFDREKLIARLREKAEVCG